MRRIRFGFTGKIILCGLMLTAIIVMRSSISDLKSAKENKTKVYDGVEYKVKDTIVFDGLAYDVIAKGWYNKNPETIDRVVLDAYIEKQRLRAEATALVELLSIKAAKDLAIDMRVKQ